MIPFNIKPMRVSLRPYGLAHVCEEMDQVKFDTAKQHAEWSWKEVLASLRVIKHYPSLEETRVIQKMLLIKKLKGVLIKEGHSWKRFK